MKIRKVSADDRNKVYGLFRKGFPGSNFELNILQKLHKNERILYEWACIHTNKDIAYIAFANAYKGKDVCGVHLVHFVVKPEFQGRGIGTELLNFSLRQEELKDKAIYVLGDLRFYSRFGFETCSNPSCPFGEKGKQFLSRHNTSGTQFMVGYEPEFKAG